MLSKNRIVVSQFAVGGDTNRGATVVPLFAGPDLPAIRIIPNRF